MLSHSMIKLMECTWRHIINKLFNIQGAIHVIKIPNKDYSRSNMWDLKLQDLKTIPVSKKSKYFHLNTDKSFNYIRFRRQCRFSQDIGLWFTINKWPFFMLQHSQFMCKHYCMTTKIRRTIALLKLFSLLIF